ncbi:hypothetical protein [Paracoccus sp. (in: a-proteobacteria)]|uniref:hypothetical protein n=1 Tax=Paracoccus sp. TaxID=267 RepID=UPI0028A2813D|nr:hypothetical protein [Paracoccus sp. (in: a-proteobacteria)]
MTFHRPINKGRRVPYRAPERLNIEQALTWAFANECAGIDFDKFGASEFERVGIDPLWRAAQMKILGTMVQGGGSNPPAHDAQVIASFVEQLPDQFGGRRMAIQIVDLARARKAPDWGQGVRMACVPFEGFEMCDCDGEPSGDGLFLMGAVRTDGSPWVWRDRWRTRQERRGRYCRVTYTGTAASINAARANYQAWVTALIYLQAHLSRALAIQITDELPTFSPWDCSPRPALSKADHRRITPWLPAK